MKGKQMAKAASGKAEQPVTMLCLVNTVGLNGFAHQGWSRYDLNRESFMEFEKTFADFTVNLGEDSLATDGEAAEGKSAEPVIVSFSVYGIGMDKFGYQGGSTYTMNRAKLVELERKMTAYFIGLGEAHLASK